MTDWTAIVPFKAAGESKTRLSDRLSATERRAVSMRMFAHVLGVLTQSSRIRTAIALSDQRPEGWGGAWIADEGRGLNAELEIARSVLNEAGLLILHADLPLLEAADIDVIIAAAEAHGVAVAPDRHGSGTNGLALMPGHEIRFHFGVGSFQRHYEQAPGAAIVKRQGFAIDLDTPDDLKAAEEAGFRLS